MSANHVAVTQFEQVAELDGDWTTADFVALLKELDFDGADQLPATEAEEMCLLALADPEPEDAAAVLLTYKLRDDLSDGQIRNYSNESQFERLWEQSPEMELHRRMFAVASLLVKVNDQQFPTPDAVQVTLQVDCSTELADTFKCPVSPENIIRLLAVGMDDDAILKRLFHDQIEGGKFPEAASIVWDVTSTPNAAGVELTVTSSGYWLDGLRETEGFVWNGVHLPA